MKLAVWVVIFLSICAPALAQFEPLQFSICKKVIAESDRLKCYDAIGTKPDGGLANEPIPIKGKWVYTESKSPIDDSDQILAMLAGETEDAVLLFRCKEQRTEALFVPPRGFFATDRRASVVVRIDSGAPDTITASVGTDGRTLFITPAPEFMRLLTDNGKLFLRASGYQSKQADGLFKLADVSVARNKVAETCRWSTPKADRSKADVPSPITTTAATGARPAASGTTTPKPRSQRLLNPMKLN